ncbi:uncharacterized protein LOC110853263 [Folsomia candida]|uniref:uncharacterized protein LOC110853263 n=1 Tax=Folsomia candida TaxID=158441 RepID=UPI000B90109F|nr:uncharacterized protein LOC110853263 [Folsomia candida]
MDRDPGFADAYCSKIQEYLDKDYIVKVSKEEVINHYHHPRLWYLPHFGVFNPNKPGKLRLVFDAAAKSHGTSLNDNLCQSPDLNNSLVSVLMKFRQYKYAFAGDIKEMFHRVYIQEQDRISQRFLWRGRDRWSEPEVYEMKVMIFGAASSPTSAQFTKNKNANLHIDQYPEACHAITKKHYVDDYLDSTPSLEQAVKLVREVIEVQARAGFQVCNWVANSQEILNSIPEELRAPESKQLNIKDCLPEGRILGMWWNQDDDTFRFKFNFNKVPQEITEGTKRPTKRQVLKVVISVFDPLGILGHLIVKAKILMQDIWRSDITWDDELPTTLDLKWSSWLQELKGITGVIIPRCYSYRIPKSAAVQLHVFCDASEKAFACVAFLRVEDEEQVDVNIIISKTRVAPLKVLPIPRLELQAAVMGVRAANMMKEELEIKITNTVFWSDSSTVLKWIRSDARNYKQFVSHRIGEILESTDVEDWNWIPTKLNVADDATRDNLESDLGQSSRWFKGASFLYKSEEMWPKEDFRSKQEADDSMELKCAVVNVTRELHKNLLSPEKYSSFCKLIRVTAWISRFINKLKKKTFTGSDLTVVELNKAELYWIKVIQQESFPEEIKSLNEGKQLTKRSVLYKLSPELHNGIIRMRGRLSYASYLPFETRNPIIFNWKHPVVKLIVKKYHQQNGHQGRATVASDLRQQFWIIGLTAAVKEAFAKCQFCKNRKIQPQVPEIGNLPDFRLQSHVRPFTNTGMDYFGPIEVVVGRRHEKRWGVIFTCLSTRAVHLEVARNLDTTSAINAIRRFTSRRGQPCHIFSDNGTNFHGASTELKKALSEIKQVDIEQQLSSNNIQWHFQPPAAKHMGGVWERLIGCVKKVLSGIVESEVYNDDTLHTFLLEAEAILNKRPLVELSLDPQDPTPLTPNHFLMGWSSGSSHKFVPQDDTCGEFENADKIGRHNWRTAQRLADEFWKKWVRSYLPTLTRREKWHQPAKPIKVGDLVLIVDDQAKRNTWERVRVEAVYPGKDHKVRVADIRTSKGLYRRPVSKLAVLDVDESAIIEGKNVVG